MKCSLIITTYNWPQALEIVLLSAFNQKIKPNEIIIADDGSTKITKELIIKISQKTDIPIIHSWQEDKGFRAAKSRNEAIKKSNFEYIIMIDGDMILHPNFIKDHLKNAKKNHFIQGSRVLLLNKISKKILIHKQFDISFFNSNIKNRKNTINNKILAKIFTTINQKTIGIKTCNLSCFKEDIIKINGFNEDFIGWGREDSEFVARLYNIGIKRINIKFNCNAYHLHHNENPRESLKINDDILKNTIKNQLNWCENGITKTNFSNQVKDENKKNL